MARNVHALNGALIELTAIFLLVTSIMAWQPAGAPGRLALAGSLTAVVLYAEAISGHARAFDMAGAASVHVPLGVASTGRGLPHRRACQIYRDSDAFRRSTAATRSSGSGSSSAILAPLRGCENDRCAACSAGRCRPRLLASAADAP